MNQKGVKGHSSCNMVIPLRAIALAVLALCGCASSPATSGPGVPDEVQRAHYQMGGGSDRGKVKAGCLAALALLQADISP